MAPRHSNPNDPSQWEDGATTLIWSPPDHSPDPQPESQAAASSERPVVEVSSRAIPHTAVASTQRVYEIWTRHRVYCLDVRAVCIEVIDLASGRSNPSHPFLHSHLMGGQRRTNSGAELSYPLPAPGSEAVFGKRDPKNRIRLATTSTVARVILHAYRVTVAHGERDRAWTNITRY